ncbi:MAG: hypothetical protein AAF442_10020 [Pseudomonadota bacterium]
MRRFIKNLYCARRGAWEAVATALIILGVVMLMQPLAAVLFSWSFVVTLAGTVLFIIASHLPEQDDG